LDLAAVKRTLQGFRSGSVPAERMAEEVCRVYYENKQKAAVLQPVVEVIERVSPGKVRLTAGGGSGYTLEGFDRDVPKEAREALRAAVDLALAAFPEASAVAEASSKRGLLAKMWDGIRGFFRTG
jgi:hypothetical protein